MGGIDWGDAPTWVAGAFAAAAAYYARGTLRSQQKQIQEQREFIAEQSATMALERAELSAAAEDRRTAQARQIRMRPQTDGGRDDGGGGRVGYDHWRVHVDNGSDSPIHDIHMRFGTAYVAVSATEQEAARLPDAGRRPPRVHLIGPRRTVTFESQSGTEAFVDNNRPHVYFTDDVGVRWHLDQDGKLEEHLQGQPE
ncbi:hypothetical protein [Streptomyces sp. MK37H]|uniref:hypothetical protein n=1 Tax=Streptomyces sp. MK37H TaxID=2699117 RepID=UPI001B397AF0|nr:hypothetical protein [Streptomyces sp. MK37H]MBP8532369.1 hypothetical protein [Streptomyces sp. MK37H]